VVDPPANPLIVALDTSDIEGAADLAGRLAGRAGMLKVGLELFTAAGPTSVERIGDHGAVFLDLKLHDIPTTVGRAARNAGRLGATFLTVHGLGGPDMVAAAVDGAAGGARDTGRRPPRVVAVTVLSSLAEAAGASPASLAFEAVSAGAAGAVVSGDDVAVVREALGPDPVLVVPGIRPSGHAGNDHVKVLTPAEAMEKGADYLVVGRPVTGSSDPAGMAASILQELGR
jgi:orotidine-5'-phosphate decarboxylase